MDTLFHCIDFLGCMDLAMAFMKLQIYCFYR